MPVSNDLTLSALISEFRDQVANYAILVRELGAEAAAIGMSYGPSLEALQTPPDAQSPSETAIALRYLLDFGSLVPADEAIVRAALVGCKTNHHA